ncbi:hypothetical protein ACFO9Q_17640 [Paenibacillus sp. GCM10023252]|uniref:hypothetical protein n=1 Tax=Paenibacillus sp. GCM10023252 TaxID=3252649 RepID=UPI003610B6A9
MSQYYEQAGVAMTCRGFEEYRRMFDLTEELLTAGETLDIAAGASSFTAEGSARGYRISAVDPRYGNTLDNLISEASQEIEASTAKLETLQSRFDWSYYGDLTKHRQGRMHSLCLFEQHRRQEGLTSTYYEGSLAHRAFLLYLDHQVYYR